MQNKDYGVFGDVLAAASIGSWKIELDEGRDPRMYADATMRDLIGVAADAELTPEEMYHAWYDRVDPAHCEAVAEGVGHMIAGEQAEIQYPWHHPDGRTIVVRCGGVRDGSYVPRSTDLVPGPSSGTRVVGIHQWVTTMHHVERELEEKERQRKEALARLANANRHEKLKADSFDFFMKNGDLEAFVDFFSARVLELYGCDQVIYRDVEGRMIIKERPGSPALDFELCKDCPHFAFDAPVYADGFTAMDDCRVGYKGIPVHPGCHVRASLTYLVYEDDRVFGYIALHYLDGTHHFSEEEKNTYDRVAKFVSLVLSRRKQQEALKRSLVFTNYFIDSFVSTYSINLATNQCIVYSRTSRLAEEYPDVSDYYASVCGYIDRDVHPDDREELRALLRPENLKARLGEQRVLSYRFRDISEGTEKIYGLRVVRGEDENVAALAFADLTEGTRKEQEQQRKLEEANARLKVRNDRFDTLKNLINAGLWSFRVNAADEVVSAEYSTDIATYLNVDEKFAEAGIDAWQLLVHPEDREAAVAAFNATIADHTGNTPYDVTYRMTDRDGGYNWYRSAGKVIRHADGTGEFFGIQLNITNTIEKEREQQKKLAEALSMAQAANRAKTMFLNNMSHDIRTPMNAIIGFTGLAASHLDSKALVKDFLGKISQSSDHLLSLINDVLDMARIESGKMNLNEKSESLPDIIHSLRNIIQSQVTDKQLDFFIDCCDVKDETIVTDRLRLSQILLNVLSNAIKYTPAGGTVSLRIREVNRAEGAPKARYVFSFKDNGIGMSAEYLKEIFDPFSRAKNTTASGIQGTGLGMAITKNIVDMMGGEIEVKSEVGKGTEVTMTFDFALGETVDVNPRIEELAGLKALVADDDVNSCLSVSATLKEVGMRPEWCTSGKEAVIRARTAFGDGEPFRVYIIDWLMPDMNGVETVRRIRKVIGRDMPIIILTAYDWSEIEAEAIEAGVTAFVSKPLFASELRRVLVEQVGGGTASAKVDVERGGGQRNSNPLLPTSTSNLNLPVSSVRRILLVEDNDINREIAVVILTEQGFEVDCAVNGREAVEKVVGEKSWSGRKDDPLRSSTSTQNSNYDLILMDIQMPVMNGYEATKAIRAWEAARNEELIMNNEELRSSQSASAVSSENIDDHRNYSLSINHYSLSHIPIIALSANAFAEDRAASLEVGMDDHLSKPIKVKELMDCIARFGAGK